MGRLPKVEYSNSAPRDVVALAPLTDLFAMPTWIPLANVFSVGDLLIGIGVAVAVVAAMHGRGPLISRLRRLATTAGLTGRRPVRAALTQRDRLDRYYRRMVLPAARRPPCVQERRALLVTQPSRANPSRDGDAKPGIFLRKTARLPEVIDTGPTYEVVL